jgi:hypothetical protein
MAVATNHNAPPASPVGSQASSGSISANGNNDAKAAASPVHRVVLDFSPTMDDELDLRIGQLVRVLHEYDDGWVFCQLFASPYSPSGANDCVHPLGSLSPP